MYSVTILCTACCAMFMPGLFTCLKENGERIVKIIGVDIVTDHFMTGFIDKYYCVPPYSDDDYIDSILEICEKEKVDVFIPNISMELPIVFKHIGEFNSLGVKVAITDNEALAVANNKYKLYEFLGSHGITPPKYYYIRNCDDFDEALNKLGFPEEKVVIKLAESSGSRGVRIIRNEETLADNFLHKKPNALEISVDEMRQTIKKCDTLPDAFVMEYIPGCEYTVDLLADHGKTLYIAGRRNYESSMSIAMATVTEKNESAYSICERIVSMLRLDGNIGFDFMLDKNGDPILTDLNPRITATIILYKKAGINFPYLRVKQLLGEALPKTEVKYGIKMRRKYLDIFQE